MNFLFFSLALCIIALPLLKEAVTLNGKFEAKGFNGQGVIFGFIATVAVSALTSPMHGFAFVTVVLFHEFLSARACHIVGHHAANLRLIPLQSISGPRECDDYTETLDICFARLYAPAMSIVPMMVAFGILQVTAERAPLAAEFFQALGIMFGAFNFIILLPFVPFPGGTIVGALTDSLWPRLGKIATAFMAAAIFSAAYRDQSLALFILSAAGLQSLFRRTPSYTSKLSANEALLVMASYAFTLTVHFFGGYWVLQGLI